MLFRSSSDDGGVSWVSSGCGSHGGFLTRHDEDLRDSFIGLTVSFPCFISEVLAFLGKVCDSKQKMNSVRLGIY